MCEDATSNVVMGSPPVGFSRARWNPTFVLRFEAFARISDIQTKAAELIHRSLAVLHSFFWRGLTPTLISWFRQGSGSYCEDDQGGLPINLDSRTGKRLRRSSSKSSIWSSMEMCCGWRGCCHQPEGRSRSGVGTLELWNRRISTLLITVNPNELLFTTFRGLLGSSFLVP
jgi:hypothetical protein